jgi:hypothetical protein
VEAMLEMAIQESGQAPLETFVMRYADNQLLPIAGSKQARLL